MGKIHPKYLLSPFIGLLACQFVLAGPLSDSSVPKSNFPCVNEIVTAVIRVPQDFASIKDAIAAASDDDTIILAPGTYTLTETVLVNKRITLTSEYMNTEDLFNESALNSKCIGLTFRGARKQLTTECEYMEVTYCKFFDNGSDALSIEAGGGYFAHNYFENNGDEAIDADDSLNWIAEYNTIINPGDDGFEVRLHNNNGAERKHIIRYNYISGADEDGIQLIDSDGDSGREFHIHHNIIRNSAMVGLGCTRNGNTVEDFEGSNIIEDIYVHNNVFDNNNHGITGGNNMLVFNNIITNGEVGIKKLDNNSFSDYNSFFNNNTNFINTANGNNSIFVSPLLNADYSLQEDSPCIDNGIKTFSINGLSKTVSNEDIIGPLPDIGSKEFDEGNEIENVAPLVLLGDDIILLAPSNTLTIIADIQDDNLPQNSPLLFQWSLTSGPEGENVHFNNENAMETQVSFNKQGEYELKLTVNDGEKTSSDIITVFYVSDYNNRILEIKESLFIEAEDYRYLVGSAKVISVEGSSSGEVVKASFESSACSTYSEYRLITFTEGTYYVWVNATGLDNESNSLTIAFNNLEQEIPIETLTTNTFGAESWLKVVFNDIPEGVYPLRISALEDNVSWDRMFISMDENELPYQTETLPQIYPVPNTGNFTIALNNNNETKIKIYDISGKLAYETTTNNVSFALLDIPFLDTGIYIVTIENNDKKKTKKIIIN